MPRHVSYRIEDRADGRFDAIAILDPDRVFRREAFVTLAEAEEWIEGLRVLMAAIGAPVVHADASLARAALSPGKRAQASQNRVRPEIPKG